MKKFFTFLLLLAGLGLGANNLQINNVALTDNDPVAKTVMIRFDISWDNSWRDDINWDAAWVFAKYFDGEKPYKHCKLSLEGALAGTGTTHSLVIPNDSLQLEGTYYGVGAYIYGDALGDGTFAAGSVMLKWNYGLNGFESLPEDIEMHVYGTEMVYIPEGPFAFGDGDGTSMSDNSWHLKDTPDYVYIGDYLAPLMINVNGDDQARITGIRVHGQEGLDWDGDGDIDNPRFPTGYKAFYMMKYETTQGQYADFLNSLSESQIIISSLFPNTIQNRFTITLQDSKYVCSRPDRACNFLINSRPLILADWMGLRPMSALEFEKSARGPLNPVTNESAWGNTNTEDLKGIGGEENGEEQPVPLTANIHYSDYYHPALIGGDGGQGPVRSGIFAKENTDRKGSGASYYGVMELSGNLAECMTELFDGGSDRGILDFHGDGEIEYYGNQNSFFYLDQYGNLNVFYSIFAKRYTTISKLEGSWEPFLGARFVRNSPELP